MPRDAAPGLTLTWGVIPSGSIPIESGSCSGRSHRPGVRLWCAFDRPGTVGGRVKSHCGCSDLRLQSDLMPKAPPNYLLLDEIARQAIERFHQEHIEPAGEGVGHARACSW